MSERYDVCIVGMGVAGAIIASELTRAGLSVLGLERGPRWELQDFEDHDAITHNARSRLLHDFSEVPYTFRRSESDRAVIQPHTNRGTGTGGGSIVYSAWLSRLLPGDFRVLSDTRERYGEEAVPAGTTLADWPITYDDLEPYFDRAEYDLGVAGQTGVLKDPATPGSTQVLPGGNPFQGPRSRPFPMPPSPVSGAAQLFADAASRIGYHPYPTECGINTQPYRGRAACTYCGTCTMYGCHVGAKASTNVTHLPLAEETGNLTLRTGCTVYRIETDPTGDQVDRVLFFNERGETEEARAGLFILAAFTLESPRLLLLSANERFPNGLANRSGQVGRHYTAFGGVRGAVLFDDAEIRPYIGGLSCHRNLDDLNADNFDHTGLGFIRGAPMGTSSGSGGVPLGFMNMVPPGERSWGRAYKQHVQRNYTRHVSVSANCETLPSSSNYVDLDPEIKDRWGQPVARITFDWGENERRLHAFIRDRMQALLDTIPNSRSWTDLPQVTVRTNAMGTLRMGDDPDTSVVDSYGRAHDLPNLFVGGAATFPTAGSRVPTLTLAALAYRTAEHLVGEAQNGGSLTRFL